jgi:hypothetical protein
MKLHTYKIQDMIVNIVEKGNFPDFRKRFEIKKIKRTIYQTFTIL